MLFGPGPAPPTTEKPPEQQWAIRPDRPHWAADAIPAGADAWTDYRGRDRSLTRQRQHDQAQRVRVSDPLTPGDRVTITEIEPNVYEARRA
jgi:hypothetical protein